MSEGCDAAQEAKPPHGDWCLRGGGTAGALARAFDWSSSALGPVAMWPASLKSAVAMVLAAPQPMSLRWGPELVQICNDAFLSSFGRGKLPSFIGQGGRGCWDEIWAVIGPQIEAAMHATPSWNENQYMPIVHDGRLEDAYWNYGYTPLSGDDGRIAGVLLTGSEATARVYAERRQGLLQTLAERLATAQDDQAVLAQLFETIGEARRDIPFMLLYAPHGEQLALRYFTGIDNAALKTIAPVLPRASLGDDPLASFTHCSSQHAALSVLGVAGRIAGADEVVIVRCGRQSERYVFGLDPRIPLESGHADFLLHLAAIVAAARGRVAALRLQALAKRERENLLLQAPVATVVLTGPEHVLQLANPKFGKLVGRDAVGLPWREAFPELAESALGALFDRVYTSGEPHVAEELWLPSLQGGEPVCVKCSIEPLRTLEGSVYGLIVVISLITERVLARQALKRAAEERSRLVGELQAAARSKDRFLAMLGHELRNPLAPIVATLEMMRLQSGGVETREVAIIRRQVDHMVRLVDDLLDVARIVAGKVELKNERVAVADVLVEATRMAHPLVEQRGHALDVELADQSLACRGDAVRLAQCVSNLLTNAARYTAPGGRIALQAWRDEGDVVIRVTDNGRGLTPESLPLIFEMFNQGSDERPADGGLGVGLALVKNLIELHHGSVTAASAGRGQGSTFTLRLPLADASAPLPAIHETYQPSQPGGLSGGRRVLIVDDNADAAETLAELLRLDDHEVAVATEPIAALELAGEFHPDVAILDIGLPTMDGRELAARMRLQANGAAPRFIALSGYGGPTDLEKSRSAGFAAHLVKPVDIVRLAKLVASGGRDGW